MSGLAPLTLGTAGHIDHGKTTLIAALTGVDTDRLPEEQRRGISIELGYARLPLPSGRVLSVIDVPGHERFVRAMVAGATGIGLYLMAIAADDGLMPQTREHAAVLRALGVRHGVVAVTKVDLADPEKVAQDALELMPGAEVVAVSARSGRGIAELVGALDRAAAAAGAREGEGAGPVEAAGAREAARLHVDRVFTVRGAGTVVTGTLWSGSLARGQQVEVLPARGRVRVRGVQVHGEPVDSAGAGQRVALNLAGTAISDVSRGDVVASAGAGLGPSFRLDGAFDFDPREPEHGERVQVHHGTRESPARMTWLGGRFWQLRLEQPLVAAAGDHVVIRQIAPADTLGGGVILDPAPRKHGPSRELLVRLQALSRGESTPRSGPERDHGVGADHAVGTAITGAAGSEPSAALGESALALERRLLAAELEPPLDSDLDSGDLSALRAAGRAIRVSKTLHYHPETLAQVRTRVLALAADTGGMITLARLRDELGTTRKFAQALLEHLDAERVTIRRGEAHYVRKASSSRSGD